jgi:hypothetical protein
VNETLIDLGDGLERIQRLARKLASWKTFMSIFLLPESVNPPGKPVFSEELKRRRLHHNTCGKERAIPSTSKKSLLSIITSGPLCKLIFVTEGAESV